MNNQSSSVEMAILCKPTMFFVIQNFQDHSTRKIKTVTGYSKSLLMMNQFHL